MSCKLENQSSDKCILSLDLDKNAAIHIPTPHLTVEASAKNFMNDKTDVCLGSSIRTAGNAHGSPPLTPRHHAIGPGWGKVDAFFLHLTLLQSRLAAEQNEQNKR